MCVGTMANSNSSTIDLTEDQESDMKQVPDPAGFETVPVTPIKSEYKEPSPLKEKRKSKRGKPYPKTKVKASKRGKNWDLEIQMKFNKKVEMVKFTVFKGLPGEPPNLKFDE